MKDNLQNPPTAPHLRRDLVLARTGRTVSWLGEEVTTVALLLHVAGRGPAAVAAVMLVAAAPFVVLSPWAGRLVDRHDSRPLTVLTAAAGGTALLAMAVAARAGAPLGVLLALFGLVQCAEVVAAPTWSALLPRIVGEKHAPGAAGTSQTLRYAVVLLGPPLGGLLVGAVGSAGAFAVDAVTSGVLAVASLGITTRRCVSGEHPARTRPDPAPVRPSGRRRVLDRSGPVAGDPVLGPLLVVMAAFVVAATASNVAEVLLVTQVLGGGAVAFGATGAVVGGGLVAGSLLARTARTDRARVAGTCAAAVVLGSLLVAEGLAPSLAVLYALLVLSGLANGVLSSCFGQVLVSRSRDAGRGRVLATVGGVVQTAGVLGLPLGAVLTAATGPRGAYVAAGIGAVVLTVATTTFTGRRLTGAVGVHVGSEPVTRLAG